MNVSILVLMESGFLLAGVHKEYKKLLLGFYPCFNGIRVLTSINLEFSYDMLYRFLSLF